MTTQVKYNMDGLNDFIKGLGGEYVTRVGVLGGNQARGDGDLTNSEIGVVHEYGTKSGNIPSRSFLRMPLEVKSKDFVKGIGNSKMVKDAIARGDYKRVYELMGAKAEQIVDDAFATGGFGMWPPLKPETIAAKGSAGILKDTQQLRRSVTSDVKNKGDM
jgi:phage gpG-like protein